MRIQARSCLSTFALLAGTPNSRRQTSASMATPSRICSYQCEIVAGEYWPAPSISPPGAGNPAACNGVRSNAAEIVSAVSLVLY